MNRRLVIDRCNNCPFFDNEYYDYSETCMKLDRKIAMDAEGHHNVIPDDCPLTVTDEVADK